MILIAAVSAALNVVLLAGIPFGIYSLVQRLRHRRPLADCARRAGLVAGELRYVGHAAALSAVLVAALSIWPPPLDVYLREGSPQRALEGLGFGAASVTMALLHGVVATGFAEEVLFRGMIAGALARRMRLRWANLVQATVFLAPHLLVLTVMPELWPVLPVIFVGALYLGWLRERSRSILAPWLLHAVANVTVSLSVAIRSAG